MHLSEQIQHKILVSKCGCMKSAWTSWVVQYCGDDSGGGERSQASVSSMLNNNCDFKLWLICDVTAPLWPCWRGSGVEPRDECRHKQTTSSAQRCEVAHLGDRWGIVNLCMHVCVLKPFLPWFTLSVESIHSFSVFLFISRHLIVPEI